MLCVNDVCCVLESPDVKFSLRVTMNNPAAELISPDVKASVIDWRKADVWALESPENKFSVTVKPYSVLPNVAKGVWAKLEKPNTAIPRAYLGSTSDTASSGLVSSASFSSLKNASLPTCN